MKKLLLLAIILCSGIQLKAQGPDTTALIQKDAFNFWIGEWNVYKYGTDTLVGTSKIMPILQGNAIQEFYEATQSPYKGTSLNKYNYYKKKWEQFWVDNSGLTLHIQGAFQNGKMVMGNTMKMATGEMENRITWMQDTPTTIRQTWEQRQVGQNDWVVVFDGSYRKGVE